METLTFKALEEANQQRVSKFKNRLGVLAHTKSDGSDWSIAEWTNAMAGECGEACNIAKKLRRGDYATTEYYGIELLMDELADVIIYADLCAHRVGKSLGDAVRKKFNEKSDSIGVDIHL